MHPHGVPLPSLPAFVRVCFAPVFVDKHCNSGYTRGRTYEKKPRKSDSWPQIHAKTTHVRR